MSAYETNRVQLNEQRRQRTIEKRLQWLRTFWQDNRTFRENIEEYLRRQPQVTKIVARCSQCIALKGSESVTVIRTFRIHLPINDQQSLIQYLCSLETVEVLAEMLGDIHLELNTRLHDLRGGSHKRPRPYQFRFRSMRYGN